MFTLADALWWSPAPVDHPESLASVYTRRSSGKGELTDLLRRGDLRLLDQMTAIAGVAHELAADGMASDLRPRLTTEAGLELHVTAVSGNYFSILGLAIRGPGLGPDAPVPQVILSDRLFVSRFTSDSSVIGKVVQLGGATLQIAGVAPRGFRGPRNGDSTDVWMSIDALPALTVVPREFMDNLNVRAYARLRKASELRLAEEQCTSALQRPVVLTTLATNRYRLADLPLAARDAQLVWALASAALFMVVLGAGHLLRMIHLRIHRARFEFAVRVVSGATDRDNVQLILIESLAAGATAWLLAVASVTRCCGCSPRFRCRRESRSPRSQPPLGGIPRSWQRCRWVSVPPHLFLRPGTPAPPAPSRSSALVRRACRSRLPDVVSSSLFPQRPLSYWSGRQPCFSALS